MSSVIKKAAERMKPRKRDKAKKDLLNIIVDKSAPWRWKLWSQMGDAFKAQNLNDPDMWPWARNHLKALLDSFWADIEHEIERSIQETTAEQIMDTDVEGPKGRYCCLYYRFRAWLLFHFFPHNKSIFGKLKDLAFVIIYLCTLVPVHGLRTIVYAALLLALVFPWPADEFMLVTFIITVKGMQFFTGGLLYLAKGALYYSSCYSFHKDSLLECMDTGGPSATGSVGLLLDYFGSIVLVWAAFIALDHSKNHVQEFRRKKKDTLDDESSKPGARGGRLRALLKFDMVCFGFSLLVLCGSTALTCDFSERHVFSTPQFKCNAYWCCTLYAIFSLPFFVFYLPGFCSILTHSDWTGFNSKGACVPFELGPMDEGDDQGGDAGVDAEAATSQNPLTELERLARPVVKVIRAIETGQQLRGDDQYKFGDMTRGFVHKFNERTNKLTRVRSPDFAREQRLSNCSNASPEEEAAMAHEMPVPNIECWTHDFDVAAARFLEATAKGDRTSFLIEIIPRHSSNGCGRQPWRVKRRYGEFRELAKRLGAQCWTYADAPFPEQRDALKKTMHVPWNEATLEERRRSLETWFESVLRDPTHQGEPMRLIKEFVDVCAGSSSPEDVNEQDKPSASRLLAVPGAAGLRADAGHKFKSFHRQVGEKVMEVGRDAWTKQRQFESTIQKKINPFRCGSRSATDALLQQDALSEITLPSAQDLRVGSKQVSLSGKLPLPRAACEDSPQ